MRELSEVVDVSEDFALLVRDLRLDILPERNIELLGESEDEGRMVAYLTHLSALIIHKFGR